MYTEICMYPLHNITKTFQKQKYRVIIKENNVHIPICAFNEQKKL